MYGTCEHCQAVNVRVFLANRDDETGYCASCIGKGLVPSLNDLQEQDDACVFWTHNGMPVVKHFCSEYAPGTMTDINGKVVR